MQPYLAFLLLEAVLFVVAVLGDGYTTDAMVARFGPGVEANPRVRRMYLTGDFRLSWLMFPILLGAYGSLALWPVVFPGPYVPSVVGAFGAVLPGVAAWNLALVFRSYLELRKSAVGGAPPGPQK